MEQKKDKRVTLNFVDVGKGIVYVSLGTQRVRYQAYKLANQNLSAEQIDNLKKLGSYEIVLIKAATVQTEQNQTQELPANQGTA